MKFGNWAALVLAGYAVATLAQPVIPGDDGKLDGKIGDDKIIDGDFKIPPEDTEPKPPEGDDKIPPADSEPKPPEGDDKIDPSDEDKTGLTCFELGLFPELPRKGPILEPYYEETLDVPGTPGCWVHPNSNGMDFVLTPWDWGWEPERPGP